MSVKSSCGKVLRPDYKLVVSYFKVSQKELKEALRRQWSQLSDKKRLKWISKALELQKNYEVCCTTIKNKVLGSRAAFNYYYFLKSAFQDSLRAYHEAHPDANSEEHVTQKSVLTKAERQLKDKFDGRPTKPPP